MENNASNSAITNSEEDDFKMNRKRFKKNQDDNKQSQKQKRTHSKKLKSGDNKKASSSQLVSNKSFEVEKTSTSDDENYEASMNLNKYAKKSRKKICKDKHNTQMKLPSYDDKKSTDSLQFGTFVLVKNAENNASNSDVDNFKATTNSEEDDIQENKKRSKKNQGDCRQLQKQRRTYSRKSTFSDNTPKFNISNSFEVEIITTSDDENYDASMNSNKDAMESRKKISRDKDVNRQIKLSSRVDKKCTDSSQFDTTVLVKEENNTSNSDHEKDDSNDDVKNSKKRITRDKDDNGKMKLPSNDDKKPTSSSKFSAPDSVKEGCNASNSDHEKDDSNDDVKNSKKRISGDKDDNGKMELPSNDDKKFGAPDSVKDRSNSDNENNDSNNDVKSSKKRIYGDKNDNGQMKLPFIDDKKPTNSSEFGTPDLVKEECNASNSEKDDSNDDVKNSKKRISGDKDDNGQMKLPSNDNKQCTNSSEFGTPDLIKEECNASNSDVENNDSNDDDKNRKKRIFRDKDDNGQMKLSSDDDKKSTNLSQCTIVSEKEENNASNLNVDKYKKTMHLEEIDMTKKRARIDNDYSEHIREQRTYHFDKRNARREEFRSGRWSTPHRRLNQSLPSNMAHSTPVREYRHSFNRSLNMSYNTPLRYYINEVAPIYNGFQLLGDSQLLRFSEKLLPGPINIYNPANKLGPRRWGYCVSGQTTLELLTRLRDDECPLGKKVIVLIGTNDMLRRTPLQTLYHNYESLVNVLKARTEIIILLTVPPVPKLAAYHNHWTMLQNLNDFINHFTDDGKVYCLDVASIYISYNNSTSMEYYEKTFYNNAREDKIHLNKLGFEMAQTRINGLLKLLK